MGASPFGERKVAQAGEKYRRGSPETKNSNYSRVR